MSLIKISLDSCYRDAIKMLDVLIKSNNVNSNKKAYFIRLQSDIENSYNFRRLHPPREVRELAILKSGLEIEYLNSQTSSPMVLDDFHLQLKRKYGLV